MNNKSLLLLLILCGLILCALIIRNGGLLLLAVPILTFLIVPLIQAPSEMRLLAIRAIDKPSVTAQEVVETRVVIKNQGKALVNLHLEDPISPSMRIIDGQPQQRLALPAGGVTQLTYTFKAARGAYSWNSMRVCASDALGLFDLELDIHASGGVLVRPEPIQIRPITFKPRSTLHSPGPTSARLAGSGTDFWGIREYRSGDALQRVNWRLAARHPQKLFTNEYEGEEIADFGFILDARKLTNTDAIEKALFEYSVSAVASLSENFLRNGNRVSLLVYGKSIITVFPGYGKKQLNLLLNKLARAKMGGNLSFTNLEHFSTRLFPTRSLIVLFSTVDSRDLKTYARLRAIGYNVLLISPDPVDFITRRLPKSEVNRLASRAARVERVIKLKQILKLGVNVIDWQVNQPLERIIHKTARNLNHRRNI